MGWQQHRPGARIARSATKIILALACLAEAGGAARAQRYESLVRARPADAPVEDSAADASVITDDRTPRSGESVPQLLAELPGVTVTRTGGVGSLALVSLRGSTWDQVGVYVDGVPLNGAQGGGVDLSALPLGDVERIEIYRGSTPIGFGTSALGGIISITTRAPRTSGVTAELGAGSFDTYSAGGSLQWAGRALRLYAGAHLLGSAGDFWFTSDNGTAFDTSHDHEVRRANDAVTQADGTARAILAIGDGRELSASALIFFRDQGLPGYGSVRQTERTALRTLRVIGSLAYDSRRDLGFGGRLRAQVYCTLERQQYSDPLGEVSVAPAATNDVTRTVGATARLSRPLASWLAGAAVAELRYELFQPFDADAQPPRGDPATRLYAGAGVEADARWARARLHVIPSIRVEVARDVRSGRDNFAVERAADPAIVNVVPAARLALVENIRDGLTVRANAGRYSRLPSASELYGDSGFVLGNPALLPESGWNADLGASGRFARGRWRATVDAALFGSFVDDLIQFQQDAYGRARALNVGRGRILGVEASIDTGFGRWARLFAQGTFTDARDVSDTSLGAHAPLLPNRPRFHFYARPEGRWAAGRELWLGAYVDVDVTDGNYLDPANLVGLPPRVLVGAGAFAEIERARLVVIASAQNLGDARTFDYAGFPLPSRSFFVSVRLKLPKENLR